MTEQAESVQQPAPEAPEAQFDLQNHLDSYLRDTDRLAEKLDTYRGTNTFPEWMYDGRGNADRVLQEHLAHDDVPGEAILSFYYAQKQRAAMATAITGRQRDITVIDELSGAYNAEFTTDKFAVALHAERPDGQLHRDILNQLSDPTIRGKQTELGILVSYFGKSYMSELYGLAGNEYAQELHQVLLDPRVIQQARYLDAQQQGEPNFSSAAYANHWTTKVLAHSAGMSVADAGSYAFGVSGRYSSTKGEQINDSAARLLRRFDNVGKEGIRQLAEATGIHAIDAYSMAQLKRMQQFVLQPHELAESVKDQDVTVALINRIGDKDGVLRDVAADFEETAGTTLYFEIESLTDIYRYMAKVKRAGIRPSTMVLAAHSAEGQFLVTDERDPDITRFEVAAVAGKHLIAMLNAENKWSDASGLDVSGHAIESMSAMVKLVDDYMKPSGLDGSKKIIFQACHAASEATVNELDDTGEKKPVGSASVLSRLAETLQANGVKSTVELYGAEGGIQLHRSERGVRYSGRPAGMDSERTPKHAKQIRIERGRVSTSDVDEVILRR